MARGRNFFSCHKLWSSSDCISSGKISQKCISFWGIFLKLCSSVFSFFLSISFYKSGEVSCFEKSNALSFGNSPARQGSFALVGVLPLLYLFLFFCYQLFPACLETALAQVYFILSYAGQLIEMRTINSEKAGQNKGMLWNDLFESMKAK